MNIEIAIEIIKLAFGFDVKATQVGIANYPIHIDMKFSDVYKTIRVTLHETKDAGIVLSIMKNGDLHARLYLYYDGDLEGVVLINNQKKIHHIVSICQ